jgi:hypothetical protein
MKATNVVTMGMTMMAAYVGPLGAAEYDLDSDVFAAVAQFPDEARRAALIAAGNPSALLAVTRLQQQYSARFERLLEGRGEIERSDIYIVIGTLGLVEQLVAMKGADELEGVLASHPTQVAAPAQRLVRHSPDGLRSVARVNRSAEIAFAALVVHEASHLQEALQILTAHPGTMDVLAQDLGGTVLMAQSWAEDPVAVDWHMEELRQSSSDAAPRAAEYSGPYADVAAAYQARYGYKPAEDTESEIRIVHRGYVAPYWYGFPHYARYPGMSLGWRIAPGFHASWSYGPFGPRRYRAPRYYQPVRYASPARGGRRFHQLSTHRSPQRAERASTVRGPTRRTVRSRR